MLKRCKTNPIKLPSVAEIEEEDENDEFELGQYIENS